MFCLYRKYSRIENGYQYCLKCGKAIAAPVKPCKHDWKVIDSIDRFVVEPLLIKKSMGKIYSLQCKNCGWIVKRDCSGKTTHEKIMERF